jgi:hypothetical protein
VERIDRGSIHGKSSFSGAALAALVLELAQESLEQAIAPFSAPITPPESTPRSRVSRIHA